MKLFLTQKNKKQGGFTLIETLVAVSIFTVSVLTMLVILGQGISSTGYAKQKSTAGYLAQEGMEYIRNMRDTYVLYSASAGVGWTTFVNTKMLPNCGTPKACYFDPVNLFSLGTNMPVTQMAVTTCPNSNSCPNLLYDSGTGRYGYASGTASGFVRQITVSQVSADELKVTSTVYWTQGSRVYSTSFSENLFNWVE